MRSTLKNICVFCGSRAGKDGIYTSRAKELGQLFAQNNITLVFGGGSIGLMGAIADSVLEHGGSAIGVIPEKLDKKELAHPHLTELHVVKTMHQRKALMAELSDAFIAMPGGIGTFEELFEVATWNQLGFHSKPMGILNVRDYYKPMIALLDKSIQEGFVDDEYRDLFTISDDPQTLLNNIHQHKLPQSVLRKY